MPILIKRGLQRTQRKLPNSWPRRSAQKNFWTYMTSETFAVATSVRTNRSSKFRTAGGLCAQTRKEINSKIFSTFQYNSFLNRLRFYSRVPG